MVIFTEMVHIVVICKRTVTSIQKEQLALKLPFRVSIQDIACLYNVNAGWIEEHCLKAGAMWLAEYHVFVHTASFQTKRLSRISWYMVAYYMFYITWIKVKKGIIVWCSMRSTCGWQDITCWSTRHHLTQNDHHESQNTWLYMFHVTVMKIEGDCFVSVHD